MTTYEYFNLNKNKLLSWFDNHIINEQTKKNINKNQEITRFFINNTFISNARLKLKKIKQILSGTLRLNFCYLKIIHTLHVRYHPK